ncbi:MerR-like helix-turn-helix DNA binding domain protein [Gordonia phage BigChungus]|uniref:MerR-like helix-turn-helix DNA binding domain protein n=1 Tax=Gordonia phage BigChungus TaxID=2762389 RepID=A0A7G8LQL4_9CAUD|nr:MerR-like helix-turn-helix DNA binding domain protein [Gordonia phage BigChungus]QNJ59396.1 MerR-like helix-turn-helix DNA binding domain protein [Gordonia phage Feastonyeet]QNJ59536.1 MerR-like helix-turn-helix DNA binding domain protein [Gordonia phage BigChungus]UXE03278.1 MerR-like helix-turn-helix DNA binding domain protein [Gordonia phage SummitAcademy]
MNTTRAADILGITPKQLRSYLRKHPHLVPAQGRTYVLTMDDVERIRATFPVDTNELPLEEDVPGLPIELLTEPTAREQFEALRRERAHRLDQLLRARRMSLGQMSESRLIANGRIIDLKQNA